MIDLGQELSLNTIKTTESRWKIQ